VVDGLQPLLCDRMKTCQLHGCALLGMLCMLALCATCKAVLVSSSGNRRAVVGVRAAQLCTIGTVPRLHPSTTSQYTI
jgi:hypothetical protein